MYKKIERVEEFEKFLSMFTRKKLTLLFHMKNWTSLKDLVERASMSPGELNDEIRQLEDQKLVKVRNRRDENTTFKEYKMDAVMIVNYYEMQP
jgi:transcription initiation factor IIE alpha subunit